MSNRINKAYLKLYELKNESNLKTLAISFNIAEAPSDDDTSSRKVLYALSEIY